MKRIAHKTTSFSEAEKYNIEQQIMMTAAQRLAAARQLKKRFYRGKQKDIREWHQKK
jgi:hypothetical protein